MDHFATSGLTISLGKTEAMLQPSPSQAANIPPPPIVINHTEIKTMEKFCYLGSTVTSNGSLDTEMMQCIRKANCRIKSSRPEYTSPLLRDVDHLPSAHPVAGAVLSMICNIKRQDRVSNLQVPEKYGLTSTECLIIKYQLRWTGHIVRMEDNRIPKTLLYG
ncbi:uncharacterized protein LOC119578773 [Penaeus monodon]|uniref:uncharacterized protein LOC119578773 n=1 Tax=Penaeus monodon TaxID=6687 RepID=UPI0018A7292C|nr:uncharacterized protein LOC119578773 [Penaeus monodon]